MSISSEIERLISAKESLKSEIVNRGGDVSQENLVSDYTDKLKACPYAVTGRFTPESDTGIFGLSGLAFTPTTIYIVSNEVSDLSLPSSIRVFSKGRALRGIVAYTDENGSQRISSVAADLPVEQWQDDGYTVTFPSTLGYFKSGYTYDYYVSGGFAQ